MIFPQPLDRAIHRFDLLSDADDIKLPNVESSALLNDVTGICNLSDVLFPTLIAVTSCFPKVRLVNFNVYFRVVELKVISSKLR